MFFSCRTLRQHLQNYATWHLGRGAMVWLAEEVLGGQHERMDSPAHARTAQIGLLKKKRLEEDPCLIVLSYPPNDPFGQGSELNGTDTQGLIALFRRK